MCEEPTDVILFIAEQLTKCLPDPFRFAVYIFRILLSLVLDFAFAAKIYSDILEEYFSEEVHDSPWPYVGYAGFYVLCMSVLVYQGFRLAKEKLPKRTFMLTFKAIDLFLAGLNAAGVIVGRDDLDFNDWQTIVVVAVTGLDVVVDPIEIIIYCCVSRNEE